MIFVIKWLQYSTILAVLNNLEHIKNRGTAFDCQGVNWFWGNIYTSVTPHETLQK